MLGSSTINDTTRFRGRLVHFLSNDTFDVAYGDTPNVWESFIWTQFMLERSGGNNRAVVYAERVKDADWTNYDELTWIGVGSIDLDQPHDLLIEKSGTLVEYKLGSVVVHSFDLATDYGMLLSGNDYDLVGDVESGLQARIQDDAGEVHVRFDNSAAATFADTDISGNSDSSDSSGGSVNLVTLSALIALLGVARLRRRERTEH